MKLITATITEIHKQPSKYTGWVFVINFEDAEKKKYKTYTCGSYDNFKIWKPFCLNPQIAKGVICEGLRVKDESIGLIDADHLIRSKMPIRQESLF